MARSRYCPLLQTRPLAVLGWPFLQKSVTNIFNKENFSSLTHLWYCLAVEQNKITYVLKYFIFCNSSASLGVQWVNVIFLAITCTPNDALTEYFKNFFLWNHQAIPYFVISKLFTLRCHHLPYNFLTCQAYNASNWTHPFLQWGWVEKPWN